MWAFGDFWTGFWTGFWMVFMGLPLHFDWFHQPTSSDHLLPVAGILIRKEKGFHSLAFWFQTAVDIFMTFSSSQRLTNLPTWQRGYGWWSLARRTCNLRSHLTSTTSGPFSNLFAYTFSPTSRRGSVQMIGQGWKPIGRYGLQRFRSLAFRFLIACCWRAVALHFGLLSFILLPNALQVA